MRTLRSDPQARRSIPLATRAGNLHPSTSTTIAVASSAAVAVQIQSRQQ